MNIASSSLVQGSEMIKGLIRLSWNEARNHFDRSIVIQISLLFQLGIIPGNNSQGNERALKGATNKGARVRKSACALRE